MPRAFRDAPAHVQDLPWAERGRHSGRQGSLSSFRQYSDEAVRQYNGTALISTWQGTVLRKAVVGGASGSLLEYKNREAVGGEVVAVRGCMAR